MLINKLIRSWGPWLVFLPSKYWLCTSFILAFTPIPKSTRLNQPHLTHPPWSTHPGLLLYSIYTLQQISSINVKKYIQKQNKPFSMLGFHSAQLKPMCFDKLLMRTISHIVFKFQIRVLGTRPSLMTFCVGHVTEALKTKGTHPYKDSCIHCISSKPRTMFTTSTITSDPAGWAPQAAAHTQTNTKDGLDWSLLHTWETV